MQHLWSRLTIVPYAISSLNQSCHCESIRDHLKKDPTTRATVQLAKEEKTPFEIVCGRQPLMSHVVDHPCAGKSPQAFNFTKEWKQTFEMAQAYLEKALKQMKNELIESDDH